MPFANLSSEFTVFYLDENLAGILPVFLFHGLGANSNSWQMQIPDLVQAGYRVIATDAPGFGQSRNPGAGHAVASDQYAKFNQGLLDLRERSLPDGNNHQSNQIYQSKPLAPWDVLDGGSF